MARYYPVMQTRKALLHDPESVLAVFGPDRPLAARELHTALIGLIPTYGDRVSAAFGAGPDIRIRAYDNGRQRLNELYYEYGDLTRSLPYTIEETEESN